MDDDLHTRLGLTDADWQTTPASVPAVVRALVQVVQEIQGQHQAALTRIAALEQEVADLRARLNQHSQNSSKPPSSDPPSAPPRPARVPRGRKAGGQLGHPRHERPDPTPDQITAERHHVPHTCPTCQASLTGQPHPPDPVRTQYVWDLPVVQPTITAHHYHAVTCPCCGMAVTAERPADVPPGSFGPRVAASVTILRGDYHLSDRTVQQILADWFAFPISLGSIVDLQELGSAALAPVYTAIHAAVQQQDRCNIDETGWKEAGKRRWVWTVVTAIATVFAVLTGRNGPGLRHMIGTDYPGIVGSDRHRPYMALAPPRHQLCWSHLKRNFQAVADRNGPFGVWGADLLALTDVVFQLWHRFRDGTIDRATLQTVMAPVQAAFHVLLVHGARCWAAPDGMCQELLDHEAALWTFVRENRVEPTNNAAEQALRPAVLWRKGCFGAHSADGNHFVERILTVSATCRKQQRHLLTFVTEAIAASWSGRPAPVLIPAPAAAAS